MTMPEQYADFGAPLAELRQVSLVLGGKTAVDDVSFAVMPGERILVTGPNGSGKSSCLRMLGDLQRPTIGEALIFGVSWQAMSLKRRQETLRKHVGIANQKPDLFGGLTVFQNLIRPLALTGMNRTRHEVYERAGTIAARLSLQELHNVTADDLSGGEKCKLAIGRLLMQPDLRLLILDEPTSMVDRVASGEVLHTLVDAVPYPEESAIIFISHGQEARAIATRVIYMDRGHVISDGPPEA